MYENKILQYFPNYKCYEPARDHFRKHLKRSTKFMKKNDPKTFCSIFESRSGLLLTFKFSYFDQSREFKFFINAPQPTITCSIKVNNRNTRTRCEICSKLTIKAPRTTSNLLSHFTEFCIGQPDKITATSKGKIIQILHKMKLNLKTWSFCANPRYKGNPLNFLQN